MHSDKDPLLLRSNLIRSGTTDGDIRVATNSGTLERIHRGAFVPTADLSSLGVAERHILRVRAHAASARSSLVVSHESAALVHGLPLWSPNLQRVHFTVDRTSGGRTSQTRHVHPAPLSSDDVVELHGMNVTSPDRTIADLCKSMSFEAAVCVGDAALSKGTATVDGVTQALNRSGRRSIVKAFRALGFCMDSSESIGESRSRVHLKFLGFTGPALQMNLYSPDGMFIARVDFLFDECGVVGEFDGKVKYTKFLKPGQSSSDVVVAEKAREDELRSYGWVVVRWTWSDLEHPQRLREKLKRAFELADTLPRPRTIARASAA
ncbi:hypothetical protein QMK17_11140 [Rhodococcus sp. G-MC3]|uniref:hypothetical protein n=1 Tax=Rhodococcus sp. G-MC3 TaxID=3046209 RepID=UPI0024BB5344|nr:hypothetical protein [Rhodococcus sp. G-MC3]MDJ0393886.1 hypothetical protein [Rhodococcus sp. G-MC3]